MRIKNTVTEFEDKIIDTSTTSPHYIHKKPIGETNENLSFDIRV